NDYELYLLGSETTSDSVSVISQGVVSNTPVRVFIPVTGRESTKSGITFTIYLGASYNGASISTSPDDCLVFSYTDNENPDDVLTV
ncbi:hypothetical protein, partial [Zooshikella sp. RANM57]|uniref:hypothetical protein n=1 Tax=Zooshikella sp. RANM57 TaxID=3425863 RepID=UPI003D6F9AAD